MLACIRQWTNKELKKRNRKETLRMDELMAYLGLELATSLNHLNQLKDYWSS